jgi:hypothetical protein
VARTISIDVVPLAREWRGVFGVDVEAVKGRKLFSHGTRPLWAIFLSAFTPNDSGSD